MFKIPSPKKLIECESKKPEFLLEDFLQIADQKISLKDLDLDYEKIHNHLINNRSKNKTNEYQL